MLTMANIQPNSNIILVESCMGLVLGSILELLGDQGTVLRGFLKGQSHNSHNAIPKFLNFPKTVTEKVTHFEITDDLESTKTFSSYKGANLLIIAGNEFDSEQVFDKLLKFLKPGGIFIVFSAPLEPLLSLYKKSKSKGVTVELSETWMREYQVLPKRTHPLMRTSASSGYLLSGIKTE